MQDLDRDVKVQMHFLLKGVLFICMQQHVHLFSILVYIFWAPSQDAFNLCLMGTYQERVLGMAKYWARDATFTHVRFQCLQHGN
jgi:hypothetical protein